MGGEIKGGKGEKGGARRGTEGRRGGHGAALARGKRGSGGAGFHNYSTHNNRIMCTAMCSCDEDWGYLSQAGLRLPEPGLRLAQGVERWLSGWQAEH